MGERNATDKDPVAGPNEAIEDIISLSRNRLYINYYVFCDNLFDNDDLIKELSNAGHESVKMDKSIDDLYPFQKRQPGGRVTWLPREHQRGHLQGLPQRQCYRR